MNDAVLRIALWLRLRFIVFRHHLHELIFQRIQAFAGRRGDNEDGPAEFLFEVILDELRQLLRFWDIRFIENDNAWTLAKIAETGVLLESFLILGQFVFQRFDIGFRITAWFYGSCVDHVSKHCGALNMAQEI